MTGAPTGAAISAAIDGPDTVSLFLFGAQLFPTLAEAVLDARTLGLVIGGQVVVVLEEIQFAFPPL